jgi:hypothetical protein
MAIKCTKAQDNMNAFFFWEKNNHTAEPSTSNHLLTNVFLVTVYYALSRTHTALFFYWFKQKERIAPFFFCLLSSLFYWPQYF